MESGRRQIELMNALLMSMPGTPIIYYGDEIGMGDNIYLGDRNGVRTPMQWSADRNAGFSEADTAALYSPLIVDPPYGYHTVNVAAQERVPTSLLRWMRRLIAVRQEYKAFGRGTWEAVDAANRRVLVFLRRYRDETILCVNNLSRFAQFVELDLQRVQRPGAARAVEQERFPPVGELPYLLTLGPHNFLWFRLLPGDQAKEIQRSGLMTNEKEQSVRRRRSQSLPSDELLAFLERQRWFAAKGAAPTAARVADAVVLPWGDGAFAIARVAVEVGDAEQTYQLPVAWQRRAGQRMPTHVVGSSRAE